EAPVLKAKDYKCPVLGLFGGADPGIPVDQIEEFQKALDNENVKNEIQVYDGAPHSFFDRAFAQFADECDDAWKRILNFISDNKSGGSGG
ncbi:MAG: dienelactone hydrolase family protein, partial [Acidimicrobiia bacterium]